MKFHDDEMKLPEMENVQSHHPIDGICVLEWLNFWTLSYRTAPFLCDWSSRAHDVHIKQQKKILFGFGTRNHVNQYRSKLKICFFPFYCVEGHREKLLQINCIARSTWTHHQSRRICFKFRFTKAPKSSSKNNTIKCKFNHLYHVRVA